MNQYAQLRNNMVLEQIIARGIKDKRVIEAFLNIERHLFVPEEAASSSYNDHPLPIGEMQTISQPYIVALMLEILELKPNDKVLEIGTGSGYQTALLSLLSGEVFSIERLEKLSLKAQEIISTLGYKNIHFKIGDGTSGWGESYLFDKIIVSAASSKVPEPLLKQLKDPGIMVIPVGDSITQKLTIIRKKEGKIIIEPGCDCVFVPLKGEYA